MGDLFDRLYSQFLSGKIRLKDYGDFKEALNRLPDSELSGKMEGYWMENDNYLVMDAGRKQNIRRRLRERIYPTKKNQSRWYRAAAIAAVVAVLSVGIWNISLLRNQASRSELFLAEVPAGNKVQLTLPDKSIVKLNSESSLSYTYINGKRMTRLEGEGYFHVTKDRKHPFVVQVGDLNIEVLGTSFNVSSYEDCDLIEASLVEGSIRLYDAKYPTESLILKPSQKAVYSKNNRKISFHHTDNVKETAWTQDHLVFESEKLSTVFHKIERWYGVKIHLLCPEIANDRISGSFKNEQLPYVMEALKMQYGFTYEITGNKVTINKSN